MLRLGKSSGASGSEAHGLEQIRKRGAQVDVKTFGSITCSSITPPPNLASQIGFNTTCSITKGTSVAAVEVITKVQQDTVPIDKLRVLAEKMATRF